MKAIWSLLCGYIFAIGLGISGMMNPQKVIGFLDVTGDWDPSLAFVMIGAIGVYIIAHPLMLKLMKRPLLDSEFHQVKATKIDRKLVMGEAIFGVGWGLTGICPGPALANIPTFMPSLISFVLSMAIGMMIFNILQSKKIL